MKDNPFSVYLDMTRLAVDANMVIGLRLMRLALGGNVAMREAERMVVEKLQTSTLVALESGMALAMGASAEKVGRKSVARYHKVVRANKRRLQR